MLWSLQLSEADVQGATAQETHLKRIAIHVSAYIAHVRTQLKQTIPKAIVHCLVSPSQPLSRVHTSWMAHVSLEPDPIITVRF